MTNLSYIEQTTRSYWPEKHLTINCGIISILPTKYIIANTIQRPFHANPISLAKKKKQKGLSNAKQE